MLKNGRERDQIRIVIPSREDDEDLAVAIVIFS
jgi:hypothetical protein